MTKKDKKAEPTLASGFRDYLPEEMIPRQKMIDTIRSVFELFGFVPLETPTVEREDVLTGGDENFDKEIFKIASNKKSETETESGLALRFDLTVPLARVVAANLNMPRPLKRYQIGKVFRAERPQFGRYREFTQCDADIVGSDNLMADAEIIALIYWVMNSLEIGKFKINIGSRRLLKGLYHFAMFNQSFNDDVLRCIDKIDKLGRDKVDLELKKIGLDNVQIQKVYEFLSGKFGLPEINRETIAKPAAEKSILTPEAAEGSVFLNDEYRSLLDLEQIAESLGVPGGVIKINLSVVRGLSYYTGTVFETFLDDMPEIGSVASGGRYDGLVERFSKDKIPAVGFSVGIDRLFAALEKMGKIAKRSKIADVLVLNFAKLAENKVQEVAAELRAADIKTEVYLGKEETLKGQLAYAVKNEYPVVVIIGEKEMEKGIVQVKDMRNREQNDVPESSVVSKAKEIFT